MKLRKRIVSGLLALTLTLGGFGGVAKAEKHKTDKPVYIYGAGLSENQITETAELLGVEDLSKVTMDKVTAEDFERYLERPTRDSALISSLVVIPGEKNSGVNVLIATEDNITQVTHLQYSNAAITAGVTDVNIVVGSHTPVTGTSALSGIYKAMEVMGEELDQELMELASEEMNSINSIVQDNKDNPDFNEEDFQKAIAEIKDLILEEKSKGNEVNVGEITNNVFNQYNIELPEKNQVNLDKFLEDFKEADIDYDKIKNSLKDFGATTLEKGQEFLKWGEESGFFKKIGQFFKDVFRSFINIFKSEEKVDTEAFINKLNINKFA